MSKAEPFLGTTTDVNKAFPGIEAIDITVTQDPYGHYSETGGRRAVRYDKNTIRRMVRCANPRCQQGGLDLQQIVEFHPDGEYEYHCNGHEGPPAGRRKGSPCDNYFKIKLAVK